MTLFWWSKIYYCSLNVKFLCLSIGKGLCDPQAVGSGWAEWARTWKEHYWKGRDKEVPARGQCIAISEWAIAVKIFVIHVNAHQRVTSPEGRVGWKPQGSGSKNQLDGVTHSVAGSQLLSSISPVIAYQADKQSGNCGRDGDYAWAQLLLTNTDLAMTIAECPNCRQQRPTQILLWFWRDQRATWWQIDYTGLFPSWKGQHFVLIQ